MPDPKDLNPDDALDLLEGEARAGAPDRWLAEQADVSVRQVQAWRKKRRITPDQGPVQETLTALQGLVRDYAPRIHQADAGHIDWDPPRYLLRDPLDYTQYARACHALERVVGMTTKDIAQATGTRLHDVERALLLWRRHLGDRGVKCLGCDALIDEPQGPFCSRTCHDHTIPR